MTTDPFTTAARAEAESWIGMDLNDHDNFVSGAEWARDHLAAQEPTDAEAEAAGEGIWNRYGDRGMWSHAPEHLRATFRADARAALTAAWSLRTARRDEEQTR